MKVLIPKAQQEQKRWLDALANAGVDGQLCDPWQIERTEEEGATRTVWMNLDQFRGVICVSPTAADVLCDALDRYWPMIPHGVHWLCNGPRTARTLRQAGLPVIHPDSGFTAEDVLSLPETQSQPNDKWLIVKGHGGRVTLAEELERRGGDVTELHVYKRSVNEQVLTEMTAMAEQCDVIWLSSQFLGEKLLDNNADYWRHWPGLWWVSSERLQRWSIDQGLANVHACGGATLEAFQTMLAHADS